MSSGWRAGRPRSPRCRHRRPRSGRWRWPLRSATTTRPRDRPHPPGPLVQPSPDGAHRDLLVKSIPMPSRCIGVVVAHRAVGPADRHDLLARWRRAARSTRVPPAPVRGPLDQHRDAGPPRFRGCRASGRPVGSSRWPRPRRARRRRRRRRPRTRLALPPWPSARRTSGAGRSSRRTAGSGPPRRGFRTGRPGRRRRSAPPAGRRGTGLRAVEPAGGRCRRSHVEVAHALIVGGGPPPAGGHGPVRAAGDSGWRAGTRSAAVGSLSILEAVIGRLLGIPRRQRPPSAHGRHQSPRSARTRPAAPDPCRGQSWGPCRRSARRAP